MKFFFEARLCILVGTLLAIAFTASFPWPPQRTHDLAAFMSFSDCLDCGLGHVSNALIATPLYHILKHLMVTPGLYALGSLAVFMICASIFVVLVKFSGTPDQRPYLTKLSLAFLVMVGVVQILGFPFVDGLRELGFGVDFLHPSLSSRTFLSLAFLICSFCILKGKYISAALAIAAGSIAHPTNGIVLTLIVLMTPIYLIFILKERLKVKTLLAIVCICFLGIIPILMKLVSLSEIFRESSYLSIASADYIAALYRDEIDDFSAVYQLLVHPNLLLLKLAFCLSPIGLLVFHGEKVAHYRSLLRLIPLIVLPFLFFFAVALIELTYAKFGVFEFIMEKIINSQVGCRVVKYAGLPAVFIWFALILFYMDSLVKRGGIWKSLTSKMIAVNSLIYISIIILSLVAVLFVDYKNPYNYTRLVLNKNSEKNYVTEGRAVYYKALLNAGYSYDRVNEQFLFDCQTGPIYRSRPDASNSEASELYKNLSIDKLHSMLDIEFFDLFDDLKERQHIIGEIQASVPSGVGIITPPYFNCFREFLPQYDVYFQEHDDGNFMLGAKQVYGAFLNRMINLNIEYSEIPTQSSGLNIDIIRRNWLKLSENDYSSIKNGEPKFRYVLTEASHYLNLEVIVKSDAWVLYRIQ
ncbi:MAG: hypothetical protein CMQ54_01905 [Gammaproteobacteria bacterium]|nr:hypothetical protein [Gammaproteobacteria bacterium]